MVGYGSTCSQRELITAYRLEYSTIIITVFLLVVGREFVRTYRVTPNTCLTA